MFLSRSTPSLLLAPFRSVSAVTQVSCRRFLSNSQRPIPKTQGSIQDPASFLQSISKAPRRDLASNSAYLTALGESWKDLFSVTSQSLKQAGVTTKDRKYILWAIEKYRQGVPPSKFASQPKPKKIVRGWGARVQTADRIRVRGRRRPGEK